MSVTPTPTEHARPPGPAAPEVAPRSVPDQFRALVARLHFYAGLFVAPFIVIAAVSGALYALSPTLEKVVYQEQINATDAPATVSLDQQIEAARANQPGLELAEVWPADEPGVATRVLFADESLEDGVLRAVFVDPATGAVNGDLTSYSGIGELPLRSWISGLHRDLHLGTPGEIYSELAASWLFVLALSGLYLWWRKVRTTRAARRAAMLRGLPGRPGSRQKLVSLHATAGTWLVVVMLGIATTGLTWSTFTGGNIDSVVTAMNWRSEPLQTSLATDIATPAGAHAEHPAAAEGGATGGADRQGRHISPDQHLMPADQAPVVFAAARHAGLDGPLRMTAPADADTTWTVSQLWGPWVFSSDSVAVSGDDGHMVDALRFEDLSLYSKLSSWGIYLHMGIMFGLPLQIALAASALGIAALAVTGYRMWWKRRPTSGGAPARLGRTTGHAWPVYAIATAIALGIGMFMPLLGISVAIFVVVDLVVSLRATVAGRPTARTSPVAPRR